MGVRNGPATGMGGGGTPNNPSRAAIQLSPTRHPPQIRSARRTLLTTGLSVQGRLAGIESRLESFVALYKPSAPTSVRGKR